MSFMQKYRLINKPVLMNALAMVNNLPLDGSKELILRDYQKPSSHEQRKRMFGYIIGEIASQARLNGKQYSVDVWHEFLKAKFLPDAYVEGETAEGYVKNLEMPDGSIKMIGSTTSLTTKGHTNYMMAIEAFASQELGVRFSAERDHYV